MKLIKKFAIIFLIALMVIIFGRTKVKATYSHYIESENYIIYNDYFDTKDLNQLRIYDENEDGRNIYQIHGIKTNITESEFKKLIDKFNSGIKVNILIPLDNDVTQFLWNNTFYIDSNTVKVDYIKKADIIQKNGKKYASIDINLSMYNDNVSINLSNFIYFKTVKDKTETECELYVGIDLRNEDYVECMAYVVNDYGYKYAYTMSANNENWGMGATDHIPSNIDLNNTYIEYYLNKYLGENIYVKNSNKPVPYVGKYGNEYKYKIKFGDINASKNSDVNISILSDKSGIKYPMSESIIFYWDKNYVLVEDKYENQVQSCKIVDISFELSGNYSGTVESTKVEKSDPIYSKVENQFKDNNSNNKNVLYKEITNIYIKEGSHKGKMGLTFNVDSKYNGKNYKVAHMDDRTGKFEFFTGVVKNGKISINVDTLSPFGIEISEETKNPFNDVKSTDWFYNATLYVYSYNIIKGYNSTTFAPNDNLTRGMLATILYRMEGEQKITGKPKFPDVQDSSKYYYKAIKWATDNNVVAGYNTGYFGPEDNITREQLAVILNRYAKYKNKNVSQTNDLKRFSDTSKISDYAVSSIKWAVGAGVITGNADGTINPKGNATRAEVAAMMEKYCKKVGR